MTVPKRWSLHCPRRTFPVIPSPTSQFAPSILAESAGEWFEQDYTSPFMVLVYRTRHDKRELIPAVNHVDDTGRLQTVDERISPRYHRLIREFDRLTGVPLGVAILTVDLYR